MSQALRQQGLTPTAELEAVTSIAKRSYGTLTDYVIPYDYLFKSFVLKSCLQVYPWRASPHYHLPVGWCIDIIGYPQFPSIVDNITSGKSFHNLSTFLPRKPLEKSPHPLPPAPASPQYVPSQ